MTDAHSYGDMSSDYIVWWLPKFLHSFPHLDLTFKEVNSTFHPFSFDAENAEENAKAARYREVKLK